MLIIVFSFRPQSAFSRREKKRKGREKEGGRLGTTGLPANGGRSLSLVSPCQTVQREERKEREGKKKERGKKGESHLQETLAWRRPGIAIKISMYSSLAFFGRSLWDKEREKIKKEKRREGGNRDRGTSCRPRCLQLDSIGIGYRPYFF